MMQSLQQKKCDAISAAQSISKEPGLFYDAKEKFSRVLTKKTWLGQAQQRQRFTTSHLATWPTIKHNSNRVVWNNVKKVVTFVALLLLRTFAQQTGKAHPRGLLLNP